MTCHPFADGGRKSAFHLVEDCVPIRLSDWARKTAAPPSGRIDLVVLVVGEIDHWNLGSAGASTGAPS
eukprot:9490928-Pyramimonas_sp.AAC.1